MVASPGGPVTGMQRNVRTPSPSPVKVRLCNYLVPGSTAAQFTVRLAASLTERDTRPPPDERCAATHRMHAATTGRHLVVIPLHSHIRMTTNLHVPHRLD